MQHLSSKNNEHLLHASELFDGQCRQLAEGDTKLMASSEVRHHLNQWAIIGSALRGELPQKFDVNFADKVMARIEREADAGDLPSILRGNNFVKQTFLYPGPQVDPEEDKLDSVVPAANEDSKEIKSKPVRKAPRLLNLKRLSVFTSQVGIAASVAVCAIIGLQTYNAADPSLNVPSNAYTSQTTGPASGLSLASYQNNDSDIMLNLNQMPVPALSEEASKSADLKADLQRKQKEELDRINSYVQGYVLDTASNH